jgi:hypothetical protein
MAVANANRRQAPGGDQAGAPGDPEIRRRKALDPERAARTLVDKGLTNGYAHAP